MELFSTKFENVVRQLFEDKNHNVIATIPIPRRQPIPLIESLRNRCDCKLFVVTKDNRDTIKREIISEIMAASN